MKTYDSEIARAFNMTVQHLRGIVLKMSDVDLGMFYFTMGQYIATLYDVKIITDGVREDREMLFNKSKEILNRYYREDKLKRILGNDK